MRKRKSGEWSSRMVTMSERDGLFGPALCALIVRNVRVVFVEGTTVDSVAPTVVSVSPGGERGMSLSVVFSEGGTMFGLISCRVGMPGGVSVRSLAEGTSSSYGCGDPGGE